MISVSVTLPFAPYIFSSLDHLGSAVPFSQLMTMLRVVISRIPVKHYKRTVKSAKKEEKALNDLLTIVLRAFQFVSYSIQMNFCLLVLHFNRFAVSCKHNPSSDSTNFKIPTSETKSYSLADFALDCLKLFKEKCLPYILVCHGNNSLSFE
jgi:hypothetical protein